MPNSDVQRVDATRGATGRLHDEFKTVCQLQLLWDTRLGTMEAAGRPIAAFWLDPSLRAVLEPLRDELGTELFELLVAHSSSLGAEANYDVIMADASSFEEGFSRWATVIRAIGWGGFELVRFDRDTKTALVRIRSPWELVMQQSMVEPWGCPFVRGKLIGVFSRAFGVNCWADERVENNKGQPVLELSIYPSSVTIESELARLRRAKSNRRAEQLAAEVDERTKQLAASEERLRATLASMSCMVLTLDRTGAVESHHVPASSIGVRFPSVDATARRLSDSFPIDAARRLERAADAVLADGQVRTVDLVVPTEDLERFYVATLSPLRAEPTERVTGVTVVVNETTQARRAEKQRAELEAQLHQAQKMEAIGLLTGGIAHDFNNLLTAIFGNVELAMLRTDNEDARGYLSAALDAAESAATMTHRLLAFSRHQPLRPTRVDPTELIGGMELLLRRSLGERIDVEVVGSTDQWQCEVDGGQLESAILNLAINARDAMPNGGKIVIETGNVHIGADDAPAHPALGPGQYVLVAVSDNGVGMTQEVQQKVFEPFFTTKGLGRGTGLGLSTVYGFARQSNGHVEVYSERGVGTTVKLYLPRSTEQTPLRTWHPPPGPVPRGDGAVVLVVENDEPVRDVMVRFLDDLGYETLSCADTEDAMRIIRSDQPLDLLMTDVILPGEMSGPQLGLQARRFRPDLAVLYVSGYTANAMLDHGRLDPDVLLLEKPFTKDALARMVHTVMSLPRDRVSSRG